MSKRRVLVTGLGLVSPLGRNAQTSWERLVSGKSGLVPWPEESLAVGRCSDLDPAELKRICASNPRALEPRFISMALLAAEEALKDSGLAKDHLDALERNVAVVIGCGMGAATSEIPTALSLPPRRVSPFFVPRFLPNMAAGNVSILFDLRGPNLAPATACASGAHAIIDAARLIQSGDVEVAVCGGTESALDSSGAIGFGRLKALSAKQTSDASRPFDADRDGFVMGEGAGVIILESEEHFNRRQSTRPPYARYAGGGMSGDAHHITSPHPSGRGAELAMARALKSASSETITVNYVNAHATSTPVGDVIEAEAIARVLASSSKPIVSSTKGATGHLLGAAGAAEAVFTVLSLAKQTIPATINVSKLDEKLPVDKLDFAINEARKDVSIQWAMSNSFGFGGTNASILFERL